MAYSVEMPELGESVTEGTVTQWLKAIGDTVEVDEPLLEVSTDKVDTEIPSPAAGVLLKILFDEDDTVDVGEVIAIIGEEGEAADASDDSDADAADSEEPAGEIESEPESAEDEATEPADAPATPANAPAKADEADAAAEDATDVAMPELGESVTEGTITQWLKAVGDSVEVDEPLLEVSTDKVDTEIPSPAAGTLLEILAEEDDTVDVGAVIARIGSANAKPKAEPAPEPEEEPAAEPEAEEAPAKAAEPEVAAEAEEAPEADEAEPEQEEAPAEEKKSVNTGDNLPYVTPLVRKLADKHGVELSSITGTGVGGRIRKQDVLAAAQQGKAAAEAPAAAAEAPASPAGPRASQHKVDPAKQELRGTTRKVNRIREITAKTTLASLHSAAQLTQLHEVDMTHVADIRKKNKAAFSEKYGVNLTYLPFFAKAVVEALISHPNVNASYNAETKEMTYHSAVNLAFAVDTPDGLLSPVVHNAQDMSLPEIAQAIVDIADRARNKKLTPKDISGGTFTITNIGSEGALSDTPILVPPQAAMIGTGAIVKRPVVRSEDDGDVIAIRQMAFLPMTYDHQIIDGADAGRFMSTVRDRLENSNWIEDLEL